MAKQPLYERIVRELRSRIDELDDGARVPSNPSSPPSSASHA